MTRENRIERVSVWGYQSRARLQGHTAATFQSEISPVTGARSPFGFRWRKPLCPLRPPSPKSGEHVVDCIAIRRRTISRAHRAAAFADTALEPRRVAQLGTTEHGSGFSPPTVREVCFCCSV